MRWVLVGLVERDEEERHSAAAVPRSGDQRRMGFKELPAALKARDSVEVVVHVAVSSGLGRQGVERDAPVHEERLVERHGEQGRVVLLVAHVPVFAAAHHAHLARFVHSGQHGGRRCGGWEREGSRSGPPAVAAANLRPRPIPGPRRPGLPTAVF